MRFHTVEHPQPHEREQEMPDAAAGQFRPALDITAVKPSLRIAREHRHHLYLLCRNSLASHCRVTSALVVYARANSPRP